MASEADYRLPRTVVPNHYSITLEPDLDAATFAGSVVIDVAVVEATDTVVMNAIDLDIESASVIDADGEQAAEWSLDEESQRLTLQLSSGLVEGAAAVRISFRGVLNDMLRGFYRSTYTDADGNDTTIATTQFEATDARRAFPCWDEPDLKARFSVNLITDEGLMAVSNAAESSREVLDNGKIKVSFATTVLMSTYLVAFIVGELEATDPVDVDGIPLRIIAPPGKLHLADFAIEAGAHALRYFANYYDVPYPGDKLDMVAIPDFAWGAMENLGCITYRETALLLDPNTATQLEMLRVASVIAHEIAHMWFGDLVTMKWWNGIWLNEAFATFAENKSTDAFRPEWMQWLVMGSDRARSQETDALQSTRPIEFPVASPKEADAMFDVLTYEKGSSVLRMLEQYLGEETFRAGVSHYLKTHSFSNTDNEDLWASLESVSDEPVGEIMKTWIFQGGFPAIDVQSTEGGIELRQSQFRFIGEGDTTWQIPVLYSSDAGTGKVLVREEPVEVSVGDNVIVNAGGEGFYRVNYDDALAASVTDRLSDLDAVERMSVVSDSLANLLAAKIEAADFLAVIERLSGEKENDIWAMALGGLGELDRIVSSDDRPALQQFAAELLGGPAAELGWTVADGDSDRTRALRGLMLRGMGNLAQDQETIAQARAVEAADGDVDAEIADAALMITAANGDIADFERFLHLSETASTPQLTVKYLRAAVMVPHPEVPDRIVRMVIDRDIRTQDSFWVLAVLLGHRENGARAWQLITDNWDAVLAAMPPTNAYRMTDLMHFRSEPEVAEAIRAWFADHEIPGADKKVAQKLEQLEVRTRLREREGERLGEALR